jgi:hypothetical protein
MILQFRLEDRLFLLNLSWVKVHLSYLVEITIQLCNVAVINLNSYTPGATTGTVRLELIEIRRAI